MPRIGVTGHTRLNARTRALMLDAVTSALREHAGPDLHGVTCLAAGADQLFVRALLVVQGTFEVVLPALDYRESVVSASGRAEFDELLGKASSVRTMPFEKSSRDAYVAANSAMLDRAELLFAIWDGRPSRRPGDTADVVSTARDRNIPTRVFWPAAS